MIDDKQIQEAIAYCQGKIDPKREDAILLAACYILQDHMYPTGPGGGAIEQSYSFAPQESQPTDTVGDYGDSDFLQAVRDMDSAQAWAVMDELMTTLQAVNRRLYNVVMQRMH